MPSDDVGIEKQVIDEPPPFLEKWSRVYTFVIVYLAVLILLFYIFTRAWSA